MEGNSKTGTQLSPDERKISITFTRLELEATRCRLESGSQKIEDALNRDQATACEAGKARVAAAKSGGVA